MTTDPITRLNAALEGRYRVERELGEGGMATVYPSVKRRFSLILCVIGLTAAPLAAQIPQVIPGWGVDAAKAAWDESAWQSSAEEIYDAWREYLQTNPGALRPNPRWSAAEQEQWPAYDLTASIAYKGFPATVLDIRPSGSEQTGEFVVRTLFANSTGEQREIRPVALTRVFAVREQGRWVFSNALPRMTRDWRRVTVGPITYVVPQDRPFDQVRAERLVAFSDSLATAFEVESLEGLTYYVADDPEEVHRIMGVGWTFGSLGYGYASPWNRLIFSGDPVFGEENRHEMVHVVLGPLTGPGNTHGIVSEGVATWLGGTTGRTYEELRQEYAAHVRAHPDLTLDAILEDPNRGWNPAGALLVSMVHRAGGVPAVRELLTSGRTDEELRKALQRLLGMEMAQISQEWREEILR